MRKESSGDRSPAGPTAPPGTAGRAVLGLLAGLLALGLAARCRLFFLGHSYWYDEAYLLLNVFTHSGRDLLGPLDHAQAAPPLFLLLLRGLYVVAGPAEWVMRLPAFASSLLALALAVPLARRVVGGAGWVWAAGLSAVCFHGVTHGCEVKPYAGDLLTAEVVLLATASLLLPDVSAAGRRAGRIVLLLLAAVGPWLSYPSAFVLGGASAALFVEFLRRRDRACGWTWAALNLLLLASVAFLWHVAGQSHHSHFLEEWWANFFPDISTPWAALRWGARYLAHVGHYGTTGLGVPLLLLAVPGWVVLGRRSPGLAPLLVVPLALAWLAGVLHLYPPGDRLIFFAAPCLWLGAAAGAGALVRRFRGGSQMVVYAILLAGLLLPGAARMAKEFFRRPVVTEFREAFAFVDGRREDEDAVWVSHPQVYEVYRGHPPWLLGAYTPVDEVVRAAHAGRLWMVFTPQTAGLTCFPEVFAALEMAGCVPVSRHATQGLEIVCYRPGSRAAGGDSPAPFLETRRPEVGTTR
jgi:hypothetical protein